MIPNIAIIGYAGSGKTTLANYIGQVLKSYDITPVRIALADGVKGIQQDLFPNLQGKPRKVYQHIGMSMREIDADVWIKYTDKQIANCPLDVHFTLDDLRLQNEYDHYVRKGWYTVRMVVPDDTRIQRLQQRDGDVDMDALKHVTESELADVYTDVVIHNDGNEEQLFADAQKLIQSLI